MIQTGIKKGTISIFNNNMHRGYSNIIEINPVSYIHDIILDGETHNFYTWWRGKHEIMADGGILITSPDQGRVFESRPKRKPYFSIPKHLW